MTASPNTILPLTGLRFIAALYVFIFHIHIRWPLTSQPQLKNILDQGAVGMSIFFMLSGFVLAYSYADARVSTKTYLVNRFARIYPVYLVAALVTLPWIGIPISDGTGASVLKTAVQSLLLVFANIVALQAWFPSFFPMWNVGASWSISVEVFCYLTLPLVLPALVKLPKKWLLLTGVTCWLLGSLPGLIAASFPGPLGTIYYSMPIFRLPEFVLGAIVFLYMRSENSATKIRLLVVPGSILLFTYLAFWGAKMPFYVGHSWIALPCIALAIAGLSTSRGAASAVLSTNVVVWLGKTSYCFYSFQALLILLLIDHHNAIVRAIPALSNNLILLSLAFCTLVVASSLGYYGLEEPSRKWVKRKLSDAAH